MLKSVYEPNEELSKMFGTINQFLERKNVIIGLKRAYHFSDLAIQSAKMILQVDSVVITNTVLTSLEENSYKAQA